MSVSMRSRLYVVHQTRIPQRWLQPSHPHPPLAPPPWAPSRAPLCRRSRMRRRIATPRWRAATRFDSSHGGGGGRPSSSTARPWRSTMLSWHSSIPSARTPPPSLLALPTPGWWLSSIPSRNGWRTSKRSLPTAAP